MELLQNVVQFFEDVFPPSLALPEDRTGLHIQAKNTVEKILIALELNSKVFHKAITQNFDFLYLHHPPLWEPLTKFSCEDPLFVMLEGLYSRGISVLAHHTNLDVAPGGIADQWIKLLGLVGSTKPLLPTHFKKYKVVTFVPLSHLEAVLQAAFEQGAGIIGNYRECAFFLTGTGTFLPGEDAHPFIGAPGQREKVEEVRVEVETASFRLDRVLEALWKVHPYEQPVVDVYPLVSLPEAGLGRIVTLSSPLSGKTLEERMASLAIPHIELLGGKDAFFEKIALCPGSGRKLVPRVIEERANLFISGDLTHHDVATLRLHDIAYLCLPHGEGERRALREITFCLKERAQKQGLDADIAFEEDEP